MLLLGRELHKLRLLLGCEGRDNVLRHLHDLFLGHKAHKLLHSLVTGHGLLGLFVFFWEFDTREYVDIGVILLLFHESALVGLGYHMLCKRGGVADTARR